MNLHIAPADPKAQFIFYASSLFQPDAHAGHLNALETGVAISPQQAARCLLEVERSLTFMQGVAQAITDIVQSGSAFTCVPGFHNEINDWLKNLPPDKDPQQQDWRQWNTKPIAVKAGSLVVWHHALPHGSSPNRASSPRIVQYVNMRPPPIGR